jgi:ATP-dependent Zn protease
MERGVVAHHELGHAIVAAAQPGCDPVHKISIIPRGIGALGYTIQRPTEDRYLMTSEELEAKMAVLLMRNTLGRRRREPTKTDDGVAGNARRAEKTVGE